MTDDGFSISLFEKLLIEKYNEIEEIELKKIKSVGDLIVLLKKHKQLYSEIFKDKND